MRLTNLTTLLLACGLGSAFSVTAQTGRIAHFSHGGSVAAWAAAEAADNFGLYHTVTIDTITATSDTTAVMHGKEGYNGANTTHLTRTIAYGQHHYQNSAEEAPKSKAAAVKLLQQHYPEAKLIGFDTLAKPAAAPALEAKKQKSRRKQKTVGAFFTPPQHPGVWLAVAAILGLAGAGLLLSDKPRPAAPRLT